MCSLVHNHEQSQTVWDVTGAQIARLSVSIIFSKHISHHLSGILAMVSRYQPGNGLYVLKYHVLKLKSLLINKFCGSRQKYHGIAMDLKIRVGYEPAKFYY